MVAVGSDITITIGGTIYTTDIFEFTENGGEKDWSTVKTFGNNYKKIANGRTNYEVEFSFKMPDTAVSTLFEDDTEKNIIITGSDADGNFTITYYKMQPLALTVLLSINDISTGTLSYGTPAYDTANSRYNRVIS